jgi:GH15 family glucan-1,4-alpha-glucosidase
VLRDLMPVSSEKAKQRALRPQHQVLRQVDGRSGEVEIEIVYEPRPGYAIGQPRITDHGWHGLQCEAGPGLLLLRSEIPLRLSPDRSCAEATVRVGVGERYTLSLAYEEDAPAVLPRLGEHANALIEDSLAWWRGWVSACAYRGAYRDAVVRSALTLKLLAYAPSGAIVAAPTTSLPEKLGGSRNWDYRYCWIRDASFTIHAFLSLGFETEAEAFLNWMLHATRLSWPELQVLYNVYGETRLPERELLHLRGFAGSAPVRVGNDAHNQLQLDVYGAVIHAAARFAQQGRRFDRDTARLLSTLGETVCRRWREADEGIWEGRAGRFHHTHSRVLCWVALDRLIAMHEAGALESDVKKFRAEREALQMEIEERSYNEELGSYTGTLDGSELDASLLTLPLYGYIDAASPRMRSTLKRTLEVLGIDGLVYRYDSSTPDGLPPGEGAFGICSFWAVECLALAGEVDEATAAFERLLSYQNDVGLFAEEVDPATGAALGNFPQAFTHIGLINAALAIEHARQASTESVGTSTTKPIGELE